MPIYLLCENSQALSQGEESSHWTSVVVPNTQINS